VNVIRLTSPQGRVLWERRFPQGSSRTSYRLPALGLPVRISDPNGKPVMQFAHVPSRGILRGDERIVTPAQFAAAREGYCTASRQDRAAALAVGFVLVALATLFTHRWLRARRSRDPYNRGYR
jgi:hypothetical protein